MLAKAYSGAVSARMIRGPKPIFKPPFDSNVSISSGEMPPSGQKIKRSFSPAFICDNSRARTAVSPSLADSS